MQMQGILGVCFHVCVVAPAIFASSAEVNEWASRGRGTACYGWTNIVWGCSMETKERLRRPGPRKALSEKPRNDTKGKSRECQMSKPQPPQARTTTGTPWSNDLAVEP